MWVGQNQEEHHSKAEDQSHYQPAVGLSMVWSLLHNHHVYDVCPLWGIPIRLVSFYSCGVILISNIFVKLDAISLQLIGCSVCIRATNDVHPGSDGESPLTSPIRDGDLLNAYTYCMFLCLYQACSLLHICLSGSRQTMIMIWCQQWGPCVWSWTLCLPSSPYSILVRTSSCIHSRYGISRAALLRVQGFLLRTPVHLLRGIPDGKAHRPTTRIMPPSVAARQICPPTLPRSRVGKFGHGYIEPSLPISTRIIYHHLVI